MKLHVQSGRSSALAGVTLTGLVLAGIGVGVAPVGQALAGVTARRPDMLAAGIDYMPVGTARQVDRFRRARIRPAP